MAEKKETAIQKKERNITDIVLSRVGDLTQKRELVLPPNYSAENALKSAWLILQEVTDKAGKPVLATCTHPSIANALLDMVIQGLSPSKKQCYFVAYGKQLQLMRSYMGTMAVTKRLAGVKDIHAGCIYDGDEFEYEIIPETGLKRLVKHTQKFGNIDAEKLLGAYAVVVMDNAEDSFVEIMTMDQIKKAWNQGAAKGNSGAHKNFSDEMAKKTVISRACKLIANTSDDSDLLVESYNRCTENEYIMPAEGVEVREERVDEETAESLSAAEMAIFGADPFEAMEREAETETAEVSEEPEEADADGGEPDDAADRG